LLEAKAALRKAILERRDAADSASRILASQIITPKLFALPAYHAATGRCGLFVIWQRIRHL
jgi:hypothetical protein